MKRALHPCPHCKVELIPAGVYLCSKCEAAAQRDSRLRNPKGDRSFYRSIQWRNLRADHLMMQPACIDCGKLASEVDHILARALGGSDDHSNLASRCKSCHSKKTATQDGGFGNPKKPPI